VRTPQQGLKFFIRQAKKKNLHPSGNRGLETAHPRHPHGRSGDAGPPRGLGLGSHGRAR
jgi:hypothetical protein